MSGRSVRAAAILAGLACAGCVERRFVIESDVPNAQVYIDDKPIGAAPAHAPFDYYGYYTVTLVHPGYETLTQRVHVRSPWYGYPPFDFVAEILWPFHVHDTRRYFFKLQEAQKPRVDDLVNNAEALRYRGWQLPQAERPAPAKPGSGPVGPPPLPPQPGPGPLVPVGPGGVGGAGGPLPGIVPQVGPGGG